MYSDCHFGLLKQVFILLMGVLIFGCTVAKIEVKETDGRQNAVATVRTLHPILKEFFQEDNIYIDEERSKDNIAINRLWDRLGIKPEEVSWKQKSSQETHPLFNTFGNGITSLRYRTYTSHLATAIQDEYVVLELSQFHSEYQLLLFKKQGENDWAYIANIIINNNGGWQLDLEFYSTPDNALLFSTTETGSHGEGNFSNYWAFYKLVGNRLKQVLVTLKSGYAEGWGMSFKREYHAEMWPYFYSKPNIGFTYYIKYQGDSDYYDSKFKDDQRPFDLFTERKDVLFIWDSKSKQYIIDAKRSQLRQSGIESIFADSSKEFYRQYKWRVKFLKLFGNQRQREWARQFEIKMNHERHP